MLVDVCILWAPPFYFLGYTKYRESIAFAQKMDFQILMNVHVLRTTESKKVIFGMSSVCLSVCLSVATIIQKIIELAQPNLACGGHHNSKNNWASSTKFGMWSYMIKISVAIAYEQNRATGVASALGAQSGFWAKSALKMHCTKIFFRQKLLQITICNFWCKDFFDRPTGVASVLML